MLIFSYSKIEHLKTYIALVNFQLNKEINMLFMSNFNLASFIIK